MISLLLLPFQACHLCRHLDIPIDCRHFVLSVRSLSILLSGEKIKNKKIIIIIIIITFIFACLIVSNSA